MSARAEYGLPKQSGGTWFCWTEEVDGVRLDFCRLDSGSLFISKAGTGVDLATAYSGFAGFPLRQLMGKRYCERRAIRKAVRLAKAGKGDVAFEGIPEC